MISNEQQQQQPKKRVSRWDSKVKVSGQATASSVGDQEEFTKKHKRYDEENITKDSTSSDNQINSNITIPEEPPKKMTKSAWEADDDDVEDVDSFVRKSGYGTSPAYASTDMSSDEEFSGISHAASSASSRRLPPSSKRGDRWENSSSSLPIAQASSSAAADATPVFGTSKWDQNAMKTPVYGAGSSSVAATPLLTPRNASFRGSTAVISTPLGSMTPQEYSQLKIEQEIDARNRPLSDEELDAMLPSEGFEILKPPPDYVPKRRNRTSSFTAGGNEMVTPLSGAATPYYNIPEEITASTYGLPIGTLGTDMPEMKPDDYQYFGKLLEEKDENEMSDEEKIERKILKLLLKIKNGTPQMRKQAMKFITEHARELGAGPLFDQILPLMMSTTLEEQERHLLVKLIDRILYKLDDLVRPYVHKILLVTQPMLIDEDYFTRIEGREIIANLAKAAGLATMVAAMRPDIDHAEEYVRNTTSRAFAVVASALGVQNLLPFLKAVCRYKKTWEARHTGVRIVQQIAVLLGCGVLPYLTDLVEIIKDGFNDSEFKVRTMTGLAVAALAQSSAPFGIESFDCVLKPLWKGLSTSKGKMLAAYIKAVGHIIPLMDPVQAKKYTNAVIEHIVRQYDTQEEEMKRIVLKAIAQCVATEGIDATFVKQNIIPKFFSSFWDRSMVNDRRNYNQLVETTVALAHNVGCALVVGELITHLKDENEPFRHMTLETIMKITEALGTTDIGERLELELLEECLLFCIVQDQSNPATDKKNYYLIINAVSSILKAFGIRAKKYLPKLTGTILHRLTNKSEKVRQQSADLLTEIIPIVKQCNEETRLTHFKMILYEFLRDEEYPEVLGSVLASMNALIQAIGEGDETKPSLDEILTRCTPILKNRNEKVEESLINLIGTIAQIAANRISSKEWLRICFDLLEVLRAHKKSIRRAAIKTFGYIAKEIGPSDVLVTLLNNLKVQERQNRVCTTIAIAIVAETCGPFTVLPALMNEYRVPELNVRTGVLKSLAFLFEYVGDLSIDYIYAVTPLIEDALMDRDLVHRQTACSAVKHIALGVHGRGKEDILLHLLNYVWPNIFETSAHVINAVMEAIEALRVTLGPCVILQYLLQGLFNPARKVRNVFWKIYNNVYIGHQDAMVPFYPKITNDEQNHYERTELEWFI
ncbi:hypothetical protein FDP41_008257 [Naegleria fowleri]|uniref:Uncharacterized protein n=1 Tax=Naegleria fowleri TaxID=5763 RepID=A0A6A5B3L0_NAEFO|nr:uncharacterized protein FDP41_008257 [Naegleria fowleri]KAF0973553.1 hypothetical protein FDP41_008257 [Naegleria fowleri]